MKRLRQCQWCLGLRIVLEKKPNTRSMGVTLLSIDLLPWTRSTKTLIHMVKCSPNGPYLLLDMIHSLLKAPRKIDCRSKMDEAQG